MQKKKEFTNDQMKDALKKAGIKVSKPRSKSWPRAKGAASIRVDCSVGPLSNVFFSFEVKING